MKYSYLIEYQDKLSFQKKKDEIIEKLKFKDAEFEEYHLDEVPLINALESLDTYSFLSEKKVIVLRKVELLDIDKKDTKHLLKYLDYPDTTKLLFLISDNLDSRKKITKELKNKAEYIKLESDPSKIAQEELIGYTVSREALNLLLEYSNNNIDVIKTECDKLKAYKDNDTRIEIEDIKNIGYKNMTDTNNLIFDLVRYICSKNKRLSLITYQELHKNNTEDLGIMALLESQLRLLEQVNILLDERKRNKEIATILGCHPYRIDKTVELLRDISIREVHGLIKNLANIDFKIKSGEYEDKKPLEMFIINL